MWGLFQGGEGGKGSGKERWRPGRSPGLQQAEGWVVAWDSLLWGEASGRLLCAQVCVHMSGCVMWLQAGQGQTED